MGRKEIFLEVNDLSEEENSRLLEHQVKVFVLTSE